MRLWSLALAAILVAAPAAAGQPPASSAVDSPSPAADGQAKPAQPTPAQGNPAPANPGPGNPAMTGQNPATNSPTSIDKVREKLQQPPAEPLRGLSESPTFSVEVQEKQRFQELVEQLDFRSGPAVPGGNYGYEQQQVLFPKTQYPLMQPYAAFSQGELLTVAIENLLGKYAAGPIVRSIRDARQAHAEAEARDAVQKALADFWAAQPPVKPQ
jgi:hypothetical protein